MLFNALWSAFASCRFGSLRDHDWASALNTILSKLDATTNTCERLAVAPLTDKIFSTTLAATAFHMKDHAYNHVLLAHLSELARGSRIENLVRAVDMRLHEYAHFSKPELGYRLGDTRRGIHQAEYDWRRNGRHVECKSSSLAWDAHRRRKDLRCLRLAYDTSTKIPKECKTHAVALIMVTVVGFGHSVALCCTWPSVKSHRESSLYSSFSGPA